MSPIAAIVFRYVNTAVALTNKVRWALQIGVFMDSMIRALDMVEVSTALLAAPHAFMLWPGGFIAPCAPIGP